MRRQVDVEPVEAEESVEPVEVRIFDGAEAVHWLMRVVKLRSKTIAVHTGPLQILRMDKMATAQPVYSVLQHHARAN